MHEREYTDVTVDEQREHHLAMSASHRETLDRFLSPDGGPFADWEERGIICVISESTGENRTTLLVRDVVEPEAEDFNLKKKEIGVELEFQPAYKRKARARARDVRGAAGLLYIHTHPPYTSGGFSLGDRRHDRAQLYEDVQRFETDDPPLAVAVVHDGDDSWSVWRYDFNQARTPAQRRSDEYGPESATVTPITAVRVAGETLEKEPTIEGEELRGPVSGVGELNEHQQDSTIRLWGADGQRDMAGLRIGVIGCGGGGSILSETLARAGFAETVFIDFDRVKRPNFNRHLGAKEEDVDQEHDKAAVCERVAEQAATCPHFEARRVVGSIFENGEGKDGDSWVSYDALSHALDCDVILNAADPATVRCAVSRLAYAHLVPVVDAGTRLHHDDGVLTARARSMVTVAGPEHPCLRCVNQWNDTAYQKALTGKGKHDGYPENAADENDGGDREGEDEEAEARDPSTMATNLITMGLACHRLLHLVHGYAPRAAVGKASLRLAPLSMDWESLEGADIKTCRETCNRPPVGCGDDADLKRGPDRNLREERS
jgi:molybdopterin/thiamine biosynthesis adenylyltransferase